MIVPSPPTITNVDELVRMGIKAAKQRHNNHAQALLVAALRRDPHHARAWLWLADAVATREERRYCIQMTLEFGPDLLAGLSLPHDPGPARRPALFNEPELPLSQLLASVTTQPSASRTVEPIKSCDSEVPPEVIAIVQALVHNPLRLGQWIGYGARLVEEQRGY